MDDLVQVIDIGRVSARKLHILQKDLTNFLAHNLPDRKVVILSEVDKTISFGGARERNKLKSLLEFRTQELLKEEFPGVVFSDNMMSHTYAQMSLQGICDHAFIHSNRGGGSTYLGPGQRVAFFLYPVSMFNVKYMQSYILDIMEETVSKILPRGEVIEKHPEKDLLVQRNTAYKIGSLGLSFRRYNHRLYSQFGCSFHVNKESTSGFDLVEPCGFSTLEVSSLEGLTGNEYSYDFFDECFFKSLNARSLILPHSKRNSLEKDVRSYLSKL